MFQLTGSTDMASQHPKNGMQKVEAEITLERNEMVTPFQRLTPDFRPHPTQIWHNVGRHPKFKMAAIETGSRNNF